MCKKGQKIERQTYHYDVNDVVQQRVMKSIGNLRIKHLFSSCFWSRFEKPVPLSPVS